MPHRPFPFPIFLRSQQQRLFQHSSSVRRKDDQNHYETLQIPVNATPAEVKKAFYTLSKTHHPDLHPDNPSSSAQFIKISNAYSVLSIPAKRQAYDLTLPSHPSHPSSFSSHRSGSYSSTSQAGGRSPTGLSRRRTQFRGPPPSFYRNGEYGGFGAKRNTAREEAMPKGGTMDEGAGVGGTRAGGMGFGQMGWGHGNDVPHFDKEGHYRTHASIEIEKRRNIRRDSGNGELQDGRGLLAQFLFVTGIIAFGILVPSLVVEKIFRKPKKEKEKRT